ncbi:MAG: hypothetical protein AAF747_06615 [Planctomycetota bacterium]
MLVFLVAAVATVAAVAVGVAALVRTQRDWLHAVQLGITAAAAIPFAFLVMMTLSGGSSTVQFNDHSGGGVDWWSLWFDLFPLALLLLFATIVTGIACFILTLKSLRSHEARRTWQVRVIHATLTLVQPFCVAAFVLPNFPTA